LNRQTLDVLFQQAISLAGRSGEPLAVILADLDHFKALNDTLGHLAGDQVLKRSAACLRQHLRSSDTVCRWGGEEFLMILKGCDTNAAATLAEKLREVLEQDSQLHALTPNGCTASFGVAQYIPGETVESLVGRADAAMYAAKQAGRNRVMTA